MTLLGELGQKILSLLRIGEKNFEAGFMKLKLHVSCGGFSDLMLDPGAACEEKGCNQIEDAWVHEGVFHLSDQFL